MSEEGSSGAASSTAQRRGIKRRHSDMDIDVDNDFAFLSLQIVTDVLAPYVNSIEEAAPLATLNSIWGDFVRAEQFEVDNFDSKRTFMYEVRFRMDRFEKKCYSQVIELLWEETALNIVFNNMKIDFYTINREGSEKIFRSATGAVKIENAGPFLEEEYFEALLENPRVQSVEIDGLETDTLNEIIDFCLSLKTDKKLSITDKRAWTKSPNQFLRRRDFADSNCGQCGCRIVYEHAGKSKSGPVHHAIWQRLHPEDNSKVIEVLTQRGPRASVCADQAEVRLYAHGVDFEEDDYNFTIKSVVRENGLNEQRERLSCDDERRNPEGLVE